ncbi:MAG: Acetate kinase [Parcubacteria group bacterium GW2011_GWF2_38_76]|nr:MAG: Acetate kinase [Parcubacteria group bacterium GW2011_GWF2_38_76]HBM45360.1 hypothetical protein [Patescibacteria group bacterium]
MEKKILIINPGSASKKYSFYIGDKEVFVAHFETENGGFVVTWKKGGTEEKEIINEFDFKKSATLLLARIKKEGFIIEDSEIDSIGFRTVAPGNYFLKTQIITDEFLDQLSLAEDRATLHVSGLHVELREISKLLPDVKKNSVSDSTFYKDRPDCSKNYGIPYSLATELEMFRFGYHGISASSVVRRVTGVVGKLPRKMIICHLGSGVSIIGVKDGKGVDASMGFTPLEGIMMSTRVGNIDPGAIIHLIKNKGFSPDELNIFLNKKCGLLGLSEISDDMRELIKKEAEGDIGAKRAIDTFVYQIKKQIGSLIAVLGGIDGLIFTATMGERSNIIREKVCDGLGGLGIKINKAKNNDTIGKDGLINENDSSVIVAVVKTDEMKEIFEEIKNL